MPDDQLVMWMGPSSVIAFEKYTTELSPGAAAELDKLAGVLVQFGGARLIVNAHTDKRAKKADDVTQAQADAIKAYLVGKGVAADRITAIGKGSKEPADKRNREKNRRIELDIANP
jgi:OOP family OmpA-OmpF porin